MTIRFLKDSIEFNEFTLRATPTGFQFDGEIAARQFYNLFQGTIAGFVSGGYTPNPGLVADSGVTKYPFSTDSNAVAINALTKTTFGHGGHSSTTDGYVSGGATPTYSSVLEKFPFSSYSFRSASIGNLTSAVSYQGSYSSASDGYSVGGQTAPSAAWNAIEKFPFASDVGTVYWASFTPARFSVVSQSSTSTGYISGGGGFPYITSLDKFPFFGQSDSTNVGNLTTARGYAAGLSSQTTGYTAGGAGNPPVTFLNTIEKFPFATEVNSVSVATISFGRSGCSGQSSNAFGYLSGGIISAPPPGYISTIEKFSFASDTNGTSVGTLTKAIAYTAGHNY